MPKYNEKYIVTDGWGNIQTAFHRKGEDYDWWEDCNTANEIHDVIKYEELSESIDFNKLLDDWVEELYKLMDKAQSEKDQSEFGTSKFHENNGFINGIAISIAQLNLQERKKKRSMKV